MKPLELDKDPNYQYFLAFMNATMHNDLEAVKDLSEFIEQMEKSHAAYAVTLFKLPENPNIDLLKFLTNKATSYPGQVSDDIFDTINFCVAKKAVSLFENEKINELRAILPIISDFKDKHNIYFETEVYLDVVMEKENKELMNVAIDAIRYSMKEFSALNLIVLISSAEKNNSEWGLNTILEINQERQWDPKYLATAYNALKETKNDKWADKIYEYMKDNQSFINEVETQNLSENSDVDNASRQIIMDFRAKKQYSQEMQEYQRKRIEKMKENKNKKLN